MLRQDRHLPDDLRQLAIALHVEAECHFALARLFGRGHIGVIGAIEGIVLLQRLERPDHVFRLHLLAVMKARALAQHIGDGGIIRRVAYTFGKQPIFAGRLVETARHQRIVDEPEPRRLLSLHDEKIETVETADHAIAQQPAFRRVRVHIVEMRKVGPVFQLAEKRRAMPRLFGVEVRREGGIGGNDFGWPSGGARALLRRGPGVRRVFGSARWTGCQIEDCRHRNDGTRRPADRRPGHETAHTPSPSRPAGRAGHVGPPRPSDRPGIVIRFSP